METFVEHPEVLAVLECLRLLGAAQREEQGPRMYSYRQLSEDAKEDVRDRWRNIRAEDAFVSEDISDAFVYRLSELGYCGEYRGMGTERTGLDTQWSLCHCQGDGVAFEGTPDDLIKVARRVLSRRDFRLLTYKHRTGPIEGDCLFDYVESLVRDTNHHYHHYNSFEVVIDFTSYYLDLTDRHQEAIQHLSENIQEELVELSHTFEALGYSIIDERDESDYIDREIADIWEDRKFYVNGEDAD